MDMTMPSGEFEATEVYIRAILKGQDVEKLKEYLYRGFSNVERRLQTLVYHLLAYFLNQPPKLTRALKLPWAAHAAANPRSSYAGAKIHSAPSIV